MDVMIDTHTFLWQINEPDLLSDAATEAINDPNNNVWLSMASPWEMGIKSSIGKLHLVKPVDIFTADHLTRNGYGLLPIELRHIRIVETLPLHHRDPFDRLIVAQCLADGLRLISADPVLDSYGVIRIW
jgi:PIN domain nuclease of toxin-antitoxin system